MAHPFQSKVPVQLHKRLKVRAAKEGVSLKQMTSRTLELFIQQQPWREEGFFFHRCLDEDSTILFFFPEETVSEMIRSECEQRGTSISAFVYTAADWYFKQQEQPQKNS